MKTDIEIAQSATLRPIAQLASKLGINEEQVIPYGRFKAKIPYENIDEAKVAQSKLILVTAITPTKAGIGKTTVGIALAQGLHKLGKNAILALREPSLGPCFGMKGGACGGGYAQVLPMEDINLHFTGDFHAITSANNMIAALLDNYQYQNRGSDKALKQVTWRRVLDVNDRSLRYIVTGLNGVNNGIPQEAGFDITPASEIMAVFCLATSLEDLRQRIDQIILGYTFQNKPFTVADLGVGGAITVLLKDALDPNLVQTLEGGAAFIHGGPFANIAHGCNSVLATKMAMTYGDYVITEAGFGADLGAEKFLNIKCRKAGLRPSATVLIATSQALKLHGGVPLEAIKEPNLKGLEEGLKNLERHLENLQNFGQSVVVTFNQYHFDNSEEMVFTAEWCRARGADFAPNNGFAEGGEGAKPLAKKLIEVVEKRPSQALNHTYELEDKIPEKLHKIVTRIYRGRGVELGKNAQAALKKIESLGLSHLPVCIAKTQYSFSDDPNQIGLATDFMLHIENLIINRGAGFIVAVAGEMMRMPGLPKDPQALHIDIVDGKITGLS
ncbi:MAG: formate--tetrahydrofolate ligase [Haliscomenobacter sp.]|uniref:formate--tetrahydrofolate ligase n=1 Tax=Haliscomenobacter sp. TaxID=2717303 RepID=UPI0029A45155|nr:formate--tetrahydrofolate ligase [Haliscomenobacter sp.]MDX2069403.1 formate--tetrahydrofolate ligase [Haliscomenobacter sp.]